MGHPRVFQMDAPSFAPGEGWGTDSCRRVGTRSNPSPTLVEQGWGTRAFFKWVPHPSPQAKGGGRTCAGESVPDRILPPPLLRKNWVSARTSMMVGSAHPTQCHPTQCPPYAAAQGWGTCARNRQYIRLARRLALPKTPPIQSHTRFRWPSAEDSPPNQRCTAREPKKREKPLKKKQAIP